MSNPGGQKPLQYFPPQNQSSANLLGGQSPGPSPSPRSGFPGSQSPNRQGSQPPSRNTSVSSSGPSPQATFARKPAPAPGLRGSDSGSLPEESRYMLPVVRGVDRPSSLQPSISEKFHLAPDPAAWGSDISHAEADDALHDPRRDVRSHNIFTVRGFQNVGCMAFLALCIVGLFLGYPVAHHFVDPVKIDLLHVNASGQVPSMGNWGLIDLDTPQEMYTINGYHDPTQSMQLVFSDEFEMEGRTFYPGDDPYWEAVDLHYWQTDNLEWYDPSSITTRGGALEINLTFVADPSTNHNLSYMGGMMSSWNKFCFTGGLIVTSVQLPGINNVFGLWPAVWTMGNLGRAGYGASLDGMWPYVYDSCDVGTVANQTLNGGPPAALTSGASGEPYFGELSYLPGQRLSRCTCMGESHPGPVHEDGTYVGRSAPEIDIFEAQIGGSEGEYVGTVSQSAQWAPFNAAYIWDNSTANLYIADPATSNQNSYSGGVYQQATSVVSQTNQNCYQLLQDCYAVQGFEYVPGYDSAYITWIANNKVAWTLNVAGVGADTESEIAARPIPQEPMYILANLGISKAFGYVDFADLVFPASMRIDWIRVYQHPDSINIGCDPADFPTQAYIDTCVVPAPCFIAGRMLIARVCRYIEAYTNPLLTTWVDDYKQSIPKNKLVDQC
ncbi:beta-glucan synthesis-associated protein [Mycena maculata]|uniref:Beta-glucan synthesis-associated protein n=1 Tax=Mycena maculata TaxID=230809 RepID=A0AAD7JFU3_9AGAR|nr:beta-glucan synthesis-associated protein [Mycena maculata]